MTKLRVWWGIVYLYCLTSPPHKDTNYLPRKKGQLPSGEGSLHQAMQVNVTSNGPNGNPTPPARSQRPFCGLPAKEAQFTVNHGETADKPTRRDSPHHNWPVLFKIGKIMEAQGSPCSRRKKWPLKVAGDADNTGTAGETHRGLSDVSFLTRTVLLGYGGNTPRSIPEGPDIGSATFTRGSKFSVICDCFKKFLKRTIRNSKKHK